LSETTRGEGGFGSTGTKWVLKWGLPKINLKNLKNK
jgi:hypothetical protein